MAPGGVGRGCSPHSTGDGVQGGWEWVRRRTTSSSLSSASVRARHTPDLTFRCDPRPGARRSPPPSERPPSPVAERALPAVGRAPPSQTTSIDTRACVARPSPRRTVGCVNADGLCRALRSRAVGIGRCIAPRDSVACMGRDAAWMLCPACPACAARLCMVRWSSGKKHREAVLCRARTSAACKHKLMISSSITAVALPQHTPAFAAIHCSRESVFSGPSNMAKRSFSHAGYSTKVGYCVTCALSNLRPHRTVSSTVSAWSPRKAHRGGPSGDEWLLSVQCMSYG